jgi:microcystin degradation protein MlrC
MGKTVVVSTEEGGVIMLTSLRVMPFSLQQLISQGVVPSEFDAIVAKGVNAPIAAYAPVCPTIIQVNTPGVTQADMTLFDYQHRRKPLFPFENV